jgi:hypothetical protein
MADQARARLVGLVAPEPYVHLGTEAEKCKRNVLV